MIRSTTKSMSLASTCFALIVGLSAAAPGDQKPADVESLYKDAQKAVDISSQRDAQFKKILEAFARTMEKGPRDALDLKQEKLQWERLDRIIQMLSEDADQIIGQ